MYKSYGKNSKKIRNRRRKKPSSQSSHLSLKAIQDIQVLKNNNNRSYNRTRLGENTLPLTLDSTGTIDYIPYLKHLKVRDLPRYANPFYNYLKENAISYLTGQGITSFTTGTTTIDISPTGKDRLINKGEHFWIYNIKNFTYKRLTSDSNVSATDTTITIPSTNFTMADYFPGGSVIVADNKTQIQRVNSGSLFKRILLTNAEYIVLAGSPYVLVTAPTNHIVMPISCYIRYVHGADEMTRYDLFIGHSNTSPPSQSAGKYWGSMGSFGYRWRNNVLTQMGATTMGAESSNQYGKIPVKYNSSDAKGLDLRLYTDTNPTSASSTVEIFLWYNLFEV